LCIVIYTFLVCDGAVHIYMNHSTFLFGGHCSLLVHLSHIVVKCKLHSLLEGVLTPWLFVKCNSFYTYYPSVLFLFRSWPSWYFRYWQRHPLW